MQSRQVLDFLFDDLDNFSHIFIPGKFCLELFLQAFDIFFLIFIEISYVVQTNKKSLQLFVIKYFFSKFKE
jgi:hypothetical protein